MTFPSTWMLPPRGALGLVALVGACGGPTLTVRVLDVDGAPVPHVRVIARSTDVGIRMDCKVFEANTDPEGKVVFSHFCPQSGYLLRAPAGGVEVRGSIEPGTSEITLQPPRSANGTMDPGAGTAEAR